MIPAGFLLSSSISSMGISNRLRRKSHASVRTLLRKQERSLARIDGSLRDIAERGIPERRPSRAQAFLHQILLGMLFAMGTVLGLALMSWLTYTYFRDSEVIRQIIEDQLRIRNFDFDRLREGAEG